jgi:hypothetical protein
LVRPRGDGRIGHGKADTISYFSATRLKSAQSRIERRDHFELAGKAGGFLVAKLSVGAAKYRWTV